MGNSYDTFMIQQQAFVLPYCGEPMGNSYTFMIQQQAFVLPYCGEPMGNSYDSAPFHNSLNCLLHQVLAFTIQSTAIEVKDQ